MSTGLRMDEVFYFIFQPKRILVHEVADYIGLKVRYWNKELAQRK
jgi:hypothetical protein